jgi:hypothetical protein
VRLQVRPAGLEVETDRITVSVEEPATVIVEVAEAPTFTKAGSEAEIVNVSTVNVTTLVVWVKVPPPVSDTVPVTVAV